MDRSVRIWVSFIPEFSGFEWDEAKRLATLAVRGLDFKDFLTPLAKRHVRATSKHEMEVRHVGIVKFGEKEYAAVYTERRGFCRIITIRRARPDERRAYRTLLGP